MIQVDQLVVDEDTHLLRDRCHPWVKLEGRRYYIFGPGARDKLDAFTLKARNFSHLGEVHDIDPYATNPAKRCL